MARTAKKTAAKPKKTAAPKASKLSTRDAQIAAMVAAGMDPDEAEERMRRIDAARDKPASPDRSLVPTLGELSLRPKHHAWLMAKASAYSCDPWRVVEQLIIRAFATDDDRKPAVKVESGRAVTVKRADFSRATS